MTGMLALPVHLQQRLQDELKPGETLAWVGQPNPSRSMKSGFVLWVFFIPWTAFSLFWMVGASGFNMQRLDGGAGLFALFGLPFVLIGLGGLSAPLWLRRRAGSTVYAITNQRALVIAGVKSITVKSYLAGDIANTEKTQHQDGSGDLVLRTEHYRDSDGDSRTSKEGFFSINDVREVERLIENLSKGTAFATPAF